LPVNNLTDEILKSNIDRANRILDNVETIMCDGVDARMVEVAGQLINAVTNAATQIMGDFHNITNLQLKRDALELKNRELEMKMDLGKKPTNQNLIVTDRESLLKILKKGETKVLEKGEVKT